MEFFIWLENSGFATWIRESDSPLSYDLFLISHAIGMAGLVGLNAAIDLRILGYAPRLPLAPMESFFPLMYAAFWVNAVSGVLLFISYPVKAVTNPIYYLKLGGVALAMVCLVRIRRRVFGSPGGLGTRSVPMNGKTLARTSLALWAATTMAGRLLAYKDTGVGIEWKVPIAMVILTAVLLVALSITTRVWAEGSD